MRALNLASKRASLLAFAMVVCTTANAWAAPAPMIDCSGMPCAMVKVADHPPLKLLIDTGNNHSIVDVATAKVMGLSLEPVTGANGQPVPGYFKTMLKDVRLGDSMLGDFRVLVVDIHGDMVKGKMPMADGSLSYVDMKDRVLTLDYRCKTIEISQSGTGAPCRSRCGTISYPTFGKEGPPIVVATGFELNGQPVTMQVDSLFAGTMLIYPTSVSKLGSDDEARNRKVRKFPYTDGGVDMLEGRAASEGFAGRSLLTEAPIYFATPDVHLPDGMFDGTVGAELFAGHVITLNFHTDQLWID